MAIETTALYAVVELIMGQLIEPLVYGHSTGLSPLAVVIAAIFWTWVWGPIGLIISTPLTLCLVVLGRHVQTLEFLDVMLGDRPVLSPEASFYQRMLADDPDEVEEQAERYLTEKPLLSYYDEVVLKGLQLAADDIARGTLTPAQVERLKSSTMQLVGDLAGYSDPAAGEPEAEHDRRLRQADCAGMAASRCGIVRCRARRVGRGGGGDAGPTAASTRHRGAGCSLCGRIARAAWVLGRAPGQR